MRIKKDVLNFNKILSSFFYIFKLLIRITNTDYITKDSC